MKNFTQYIEQQHPDITPKVPVPLRKGEKHCPHCGGYGEHPVDKNDPRQTITRKKCRVCDGTGKQLDSGTGHIELDGFDD